MTANKLVRLAFVDDDENLLSSHRRNFARLRPDWEGVFLNDPIAARDAITADADIAAVILDIHMPGMTGLELAAELRKARKDLIILMLTGYADLQSALLAVNELGVFRFYPKPTMLETMLDDIDAEIKSRLGQNEDTLPTEFLDLFELGVIAVDADLNILHLNAQGLMYCVDHPWCDQVHKGSSSLIRTPKDWLASCHRRARPCRAVIKVFRLNAMVKNSRF